MLLPNLIIPQSPDGRFSVSVRCINQFFRLRKILNKSNRTENSRWCTECPEQRYQLLPNVFIHGLVKYCQFFEICPGSRRMRVLKFIQSINEHTLQLYEMKMNKLIYLHSLVTVVQNLVSITNCFNCIFSILQQ